MKWRTLVRVKLTYSAGGHRPRFPSTTDGPGVDPGIALVILSSFPSVNHLEGKQALTLEAVLERHSAVFLEELGHISG